MHRNLDTRTFSLPASVIKADTTAGNRTRVLRHSCTTPQIRDGAARGIHISELLSAPTPRHESPLIGKGHPFRPPLQIFTLRRARVRQQKRAQRFSSQPSSLLYTPTVMRHKCASRALYSAALPVTPPIMFEDVADASSLLTKGECNKRIVMRSRPRARSCCITGLRQLFRSTRGGPRLQSFAAVGGNRQVKFRSRIDLRQILQSPSPYFCWNGTQTDDDD